MSTVQAQQSSLKALIAKGKEQNYLTYAQVNDHLPDTISDPDQVEDIIQMIDDMGIKVFETAPDADQLLMIESETDELAAAEAAAALAAVENEAGRTTDPVRMYMREMGTVELLTREGEIVIAKRIEEGIRELMSAMAFFPGTSKASDEYDWWRKKKETGRYSYGYLDLARRCALACHEEPPAPKLTSQILMMTTTVTTMTMKRQPVLIPKKRAYRFDEYANRSSPCVS